MTTTENDNDNNNNDNDLFKGLFNNSLMMISSFS